MNNIDKLQQEKDAMKVRHAQEDQRLNDRLRQAKETEKRKREREKITEKMSISRLILKLESIVRKCDYHE